jgi:hypothetical protein
MPRKAAFSSHQITNMRSLPGEAIANPLSEGNDPAQELELKS